jgi:hypothetical protein
MQVLSKLTVEAAGFEVTEERCAALPNEAKWFMVWAGVWIVALAVLLPALI